MESISVFPAIFSLGFLGFSGLFGVIWMIIWMVMCIISVGGLILWILMLIDVIKRGETDFPSSGDNQKLLWILIIALTGWIGGLIYYFVVYRPQNEAKA